MTQCTTHEALASYRRPNENKGPTNTFTAQRRFGERLRGELASIKADIRDAREKASQDPPPSRPYSGVPPLTAAASGAFMAWLTTRLNTGYLQVVTPDRNQFIQASYATGIRSAHRELQEITDGGPSEYPIQDVSDTLDSRRHSRELSVIRDRVYSNLEDIADDAAEEVRQELLEGVRDGENPNKIARRINDRIDSVGKARSTVLARSEVMNAYSQAKLERAREYNQDPTIGQISAMHGEWLTALDEDVCPFCRRLQGVALSVSEMLGTPVEFRGQVYRLRSPAHPQGRCDTLLMPGSPDGSLEERLPNEFTILS